MQPDDINRALKKLAGLFPGQITQDQGKLLFRELKAFDEKSVNDAIADHAKTRERFNLAQLIEGCRAGDRAAQEKVDNSSKEGTWFDVQRRHRSQLADASNVEVALRVYRAHWIKCGGSDAYKSKFLSECQTMLFIAGIPLEHCRRWAESILDDPVTFRQVLEDVRGNAPAFTAA